MSQFDHTIVQIEEDAIQQTIRHYQIAQQKVNYQNILMLNSQRHTLSPVQGVSHTLSPVGVSSSGLGLRPAAWDSVPRLRRSPFAVRPPALPFAQALPFSVVLNSYPTVQQGVHQAIQQYQATTQYVQVYKDSIV